MFLMEKNTVYSQSTSNTREYGTGEYHKIIMAYNNMVIEIEIKRFMMERFSLSFVVVPLPKLLFKNSI